MPGDYGLPDPPLNSPSGTTTPVIPQGDSQLLDLLQEGNPEEGQIHGWLVCVTWNIFSAATSQFHVLWQARQ